MFTPLKLFNIVALLTFQPIFHTAAIICYSIALLGSTAVIFCRRVKISFVLTPALLGLLAQLIQLVSRWHDSGHLPVMGLFETQHFLALWVAAATIYFYLRYKIIQFLPAGLGFSLLALLFAGLGPMTIIPLTPAIDTPLFLIHVAASFAAYGLFGTAALAGAYQLVHFWSASDEQTIARVMDESLYLGFILFTFCMIAGSIWAYLEWGSYWTWKIKGLWSYLLWFYYAGVIHVRHRNWWLGKPVSLLAMGGFALVLFTYLGLGLLFKTSHPLL